MEIKLKAKYLRTVNGTFRGGHNDGLRRHTRHKVGRKDVWTPEAALVIDMRNHTRKMVKF